MKLIKHIVKLSLIGGLVGSVASAEEFKPAVIYDVSGKHDKSFGEAAYNGAERFKKDTGIKYKDFEPSKPIQIQQTMERFAKRKYSPIVGVGFILGPIMEGVAKKYPDVSFTVIDAVVDLPNVQSVLYKEHEGSFLVGMLAAMKSKTGVVGFVGGMDIPTIKRFGCGYEQGAKHVNSNMQVIHNMTGTDHTAWSNPTRAGELARAQFQKGADVIFAAAGGSGLGVYQAAKEAGKYAIGVDSNQNYLHPGTMLTSMVKRVDVGVYNSFNDSHQGKFQAGVVTLGLKEDGVGWAYDQYNKDLITAEMKASVEQARKDIISGKVKVVDYIANNNKCTY